MARRRILRWSIENPTASTNHDAILSNGLPPDQRGWAVSAFGCTTREDVERVCDIPAWHGRPVVRLCPLCNELLRSDQLLVWLRASELTVRCGSRRRDGAGGKPLPAPLPKQQRRTPDQLDRQPRRRGNNAPADTSWAISRRELQFRYCRSPGRQISISALLRTPLWYRGWATRAYCRPFLSRIFVSGATNA